MQQIISLSSIYQFTIVVGAGGAGGSSSKNIPTCKAGQDSSVTVNSNTYTAAGGLCETYYNVRITRVTNSSIGGHVHNINWAYIQCTADIDGLIGQNGQQNTFDINDINLYAPGGNGGWNTYRHGTPNPVPSTPQTDGARGGIGGNNSTLNQGQDGLFYGGGGGGGAFSSGHKYSQGGAGHCGIVIIYGQNSL